MWPPPQPQTQFYTSIAKLFENPQQMSIKLGRGVHSLVYLSKVGFKTTFLYSTLFVAFLNP